MSKKRTLHSFFASSPVTAKKLRLSEAGELKSEKQSVDKVPGEVPEHHDNSFQSQSSSTHSTYPFPIAEFSESLKDGLEFVPATDGRPVNDQLDLDLLYFEPYIPSHIHHQLFLFLRSSLPFYRVKYTMKRGAIETQINTPRFTTVFGLDDTSRFSADQAAILDATTKKPVVKDKYKCSPRPIPSCLDKLRLLTEATTGESFNFCLVNYYASGDDSITYHSDDERFLGHNPSIASFSLGAKRDFLMKHKPLAPDTDIPEPKPLKLPLASGDMILMRGRTQSHWLHSIPKRKGGESERGRINITFRKAMVPGGTMNYYHYNVGSGGVYKWNKEAQQMLPWSPGPP